VYQILDIPLDGLVPFSPILDKLKVLTTSTQKPQKPDKPNGPCIQERKGGSASPQFFTSVEQSILVAFFSVKYSFQKAE
jgi:hypothetical protein